MNTTKRLSVTKHILLGTVLTVAAFATIGWGLATAADAAYAQFLASQANDPWGGTNPYGCCQTNYDVNGVLYHGAPDCKHPAILAARV